MPKVVPKIEAKTLDAITEPGRHAVGGAKGLLLQISPTGAKSWLLRIKVGSKRRDMGLGAYPDTTLAQARVKANAVREEVAKGLDPILERAQAKSRLIAQQAASKTFKEAASAYMKAKSPEWKNPKHAGQWAATLETYAYPVIGTLHVGHVEQRHVLAILEPIWQTKTETATRLRGRIENVLDWAEVHHLRTGKNPARWRGHLDKILANPNKIAKVKNYPAVQVDEAHKFLTALKGHEGITARALEFIAYTAARSGEVRGASWSEFDMQAAIWTIPGERMKAGKEHRVPLTEPAMALLRDLPRIEGSTLVFPAPRGGLLSDMAPNMLMRRMGFKDKAGLLAVPHGLRSTFRDWAAERTNFPRDLAERALAHTLESKTEAAYQRGDLLDRRRTLMDAWAAFLATPQTNDNKIVQFSRNAA